PERVATDSSRLRGLGAYASSTAAKAMAAERRRLARARERSARGRYYWWQEIPPSWDDPDARFFGGFAIYSAPQPWGRWTPVYYTEKWDVGPGEKGELPTKWMSASGIGASGDMYLVFSGDDHLAIRKGT